MLLLAHIARRSKGTVERSGVLRSRQTARRWHRLQRIGHVRLWDAITGTYRQTLEGHTGVVTYVAFSPDGKTIASASSDKTVRLWDATTGAHRQTLNSHGDAIKHIAQFLDDTMDPYRRTVENGDVLSKILLFSPDDRWIMWDSEHRLWLPLEFRPFCSAIAPGAQTVVVGTWAGRVLVLRFLSTVAAERWQ